MHRWRIPMPLPAILDCETTNNISSLAIYNTNLSGGVHSFDPSHNLMSHSPAAESDTPSTRPMQSSVPQNNEHFKNYTQASPRHLEGCGSAPRNF